MQKKSWLIGATALATVAVFGAFGIHSVKATETESKSAKEQIIFEQVGQDTYSKCAYGKTGMMLSAEDGKYYAKIDSDGTMTELDNSDGKYKTIAISSSCNIENGILSVDEDWKGAVLDYDGNFAYGTDKYYKDITTLKVAGQSLCAYVENEKVHINNINGDKLFEVSLPDNHSDYIRINSYVKYIGITYGIDNSWKTLYYDLEGNEVSSSQAQEYASVNYDSIYNTSGYLFGSANNQVYREFENGYRSFWNGVLKGQKVYLGYNPYDDSTYGYAILDEEGNELLKYVYNTYTAFGDKIVVGNRKDPEDKRSGYNFHIVKAVLATELKKDDANNSVAEIVADSATLGNNVTYDDLDADAKGVYNQKFNFNIKAANGVLDDGAYLSIAKTVSGANYEAAKKVTKEAASHIAVFNIDLLKDGAKIQPNGNIEFTVDVPNNFNKDLIAVYRLSSDGTSYVKLTSSVKDGKVTFVTDHFSTYIIAEEKTVINAGDNNNNSGNNNDNTGNKDNNNASNNENSNIGNGNGTNNNEQASGAEASNVEASNAEASNTSTATGDTTNYIIYIAVLLCAVAVGVVAMTSKKRAK